MVSASNVTSMSISSIQRPKMDSLRISFLSPYRRSFLGDLLNETHDISLELVAAFGTMFNILMLFTKLLQIPFLEGERWWRLREKAFLLNLGQNFSTTSIQKSVIFPILCSHNFSARLSTASWRTPFLLTVLSLLLEGHFGLIDFGLERLILTLLVRCIYQNVPVAQIRRLTFASQQSVLARRRSIDRQEL